jgi:hypothetical protein
VTAESNSNNFCLFFGTDESKIDRILLDPGQKMQLFVAIKPALLADAWRGVCRMWKGGVVVTCEVGFFYFYFWKLIFEEKESYYGFGHTRDAIFEKSCSILKVTRNGRVFSAFSNVRNVLVTRKKIGTGSKRRSSNQLR